MDGLYRFLGEHPENLLTCDFACGGVASPGVWERFVESMNYVKRHRAVEVRFCEKMKGEKERRFRVRFEGGGTFDAPLGKSQLGRGIARRLFLRPACYHCAYANTNRPADLTMGALWELPKEPCPREQKDGASLLLINTVKGAHIFDRLSLKREIRKLHEAQKLDGYALIPLSVYFKNGLVKVELGVCKGKKNYDKRQSIAERDAKREMDRARKERY